MRILVAIAKSSVQRVNSDKIALSAAGAANSVVGDVFIRWTVGGCQKWRVQYGWFFEGDRPLLRDAACRQSDKQGNNQFFHGVSSCVL